MECPRKNQHSSLTEELQHDDDPMGVGVVEAVEVVLGYPEPRCSGWLHEDLATRLMSMAYVYR